MRIIIILHVSQNLAKRWRFLSTILLILTSAVPEDLSQAWNSSTRTSQREKAGNQKKTNEGNFDEQKYWMKKMLRRGRRCREEREEDAEMEKKMPRRRGRRC